MAIVQVSRITNRKGLTENLPQLAGAELGYCLDSRRLFIGNGTLQEGAPVIGNTEILTEFSDITVLSEYTYKDSTVGYAAQTGPTPSDPVVRTVQAKLDDFADVRDFGATGDGVTDDTAAINRALYQLYCRETNTEIRRSLFFPAGTYLITDTINIPTYAKIVGEGADCTIVLLDNALVTYVARYADSLQQTGVNIGNNGATPPRNIEISSMTFQSTAAPPDIFLVENATQCYFDSVNFRGPLTTTDIITNQASDDTAGIRFSSTINQVCTQINFDKCRFRGTTYGINTDMEINGITVSNSDFNTLYQGIVLGAGVIVNGGATGFRTVSNIFDTIFGEGIVYDQVSLNATAYNVFYDVGNGYTGGATTPVITFGNDNNVSVSDLFARTDTNASIFPRVSITGGATNTGTQIQIGRYARETGRTFSMTNGVSQPIFTVNADLIPAFRVDYTIVHGSEFRTGTFTVVAGAPNYNDDYIESTNMSISLSAAQGGSTVTVQYTNTGTTANLTYSISHLA